MMDTQLWGTPPADFWGAAYLDSLLLVLGLGGGRKGLSILILITVFILTTGRKGDLLQAPPTPPLLRLLPSISEDGKHPC